MLLALASAIDCSARNAARRSRSGSSASTADMLGSSQLLGRSVQRENTKSGAERLFRARHNAGISLHCRDSDNAGRYRPGRYFNDSTTLRETASVTPSPGPGLRAHGETN